MDSMQVETLQCQREERVSRIVESLANLVETLLHDVLIDAFFIVIDGDRLA